MTMMFDLGTLFEGAAELAECTVRVGPGAEYSLSDLAVDQVAVMAIFSSPTTSMVAIQGTLHGCVLALRSIPTSSRWLREITGHPPVPSGLYIAAAEFDSAIEWLRLGVTSGPDDEGLAQQVMDKVMGWPNLRDLSTNATGQVLALVVVADAVCTMSRRSS